VIPNIVNGEAELIYTGANLGDYVLEINNPLKDGEGGFCSNFVDVEIIDQQSGTPVELEPFENEICEGTDAVITPTVDAQYNPSNLEVPFLWYTSEDRLGGPLPANGPAVIDGSNVIVAIDNLGTITISGLEADGLNPKDYTLYVETDFENVGNFCQINGVVEISAVITVYPSLEITPTLEADWCRDGSGEIMVEALGGNGDKTFTLFDDQNNFIESQIKSRAKIFKHGFAIDRTLKDKVRVTIVAAMFDEEEKEEIMLRTTYLALSVVLFVFSILLQGLCRRVFERGPSSYRRVKCNQKARKKSGTCGPAAQINQR
jgi:hypothetical protein